MTSTLALPEIDKDLLERLARTIRGLAIDGVEAANSGHPGMPLGCADMAAVLWYYHLNANPADPDWKNRDRFVLSAGHGSMLIYALLHLAGYELSLEELKNFRQFGSKTPGHPENFVTRGVETTTGPLGQGFANGVGMALSAHMMHARFPELVDHFVYGIVSDGDLMEGVAAEAASFAGHHKLGRLIYLYDDNQITIEGDTDLTFTGEDVAKRFEAYGWQVLRAHGHNVDAINRALTEAKTNPDQPTLIVCRTTIGFGSPNKSGTAGVHGSPLGTDETKLTKKALGLDPEKTFDVPAEDLEAWKKCADRVAEAQKAWEAKLAAADEQTRKAFLAHYEQSLPDLKELRPESGGKAVATRKSAGAAENAYAAALPWLAGGSADLAPSTNTLIKGEESIGAGAFEGRNLHWGIREHAMGSICNGMVLHGAFRPFGATFLVFSDYMRPAIRLAALMKLPVVYVFTHDSIFLGEDGPTHQPVEHYAALRAIPNLTVVRPGDDEESFVAWEIALKNTEGPTALLLSRQNLPWLDRAGKGLAAADEAERGGYVLQDCDGDPKVILIATGSELHLALEAGKQLDGARVVSMPSVELFRSQPKTYRDDVLPPSCRRRVVIESGIRQGWHDIATDEGAFVTQDTFGASAPAENLAAHFGFTVDNVIEIAKGLEG